jgi:hypothetical protein
MRELYPVVRNIFNNELYKYLGNDEYINIRTGKKGFVKPEVAEKIFRINVEATGICNDFPIVEELIKSLNLKIEK